MFSRMPVPVWDMDMVFLEEPLDSTTVVSDDIWKKFDLDVPLENYQYRYKNEFANEASSAVAVTGTSLQHLEQQQPPPMMMMNLDKLSCQASREIRHHDCMWAGLCISKEHNRTHPARKDPQLHRRIPAGRSLLIAKNSTGPQTQSGKPTTAQPASTAQQQQQLQQQQQQQQPQYSKSKNLESDGDSTRPDTPQSSESESESEEEEEEDEVPVFRHEQISFTELNNIVSMPVSEVTNQQVLRRPGLYDRRKESERAPRGRPHSQPVFNNEAVIRSTLMSDHCYHLNNNQSISNKFEHLGVQTPSDSEEEIDVVSYEKPTRPGTSTAAALSLPPHASPAEQKRFQQRVNTAIRERLIQREQAKEQAKEHVKSEPQDEEDEEEDEDEEEEEQEPTTVQVTAPRPRGRPPNNPRKRQLALEAHQQQQQRQQQEGGRPAKRSRVRAQQQHQQQQQHQRKQRASPKSTSISPASTPTKSNSGNSSSSGNSRQQQSRSSSDDSEPDSEKRNMHNNMERQRRVELRYAFDDLRVLVPAIEDKEKAAKVTILRQSALYCDKLIEQEASMLGKIRELKDKQERLRAHLRQLRRDRAMQFR